MVDRTMNQQKLQEAIEIFSGQNPQANLTSPDCQKQLAEWISSFLGNKNADD